MKLAIDILMSFIILFWPGLMMFSPMMFDEPGSEFSRAKLLFLVGVIFYPSAIFMGYMLFNASFFGLSATILFMAALLVATGVSVFFGYPKFIIDGWRGNLE